MLRIFAHLGLLLASAAVHAEDMQYPLAAAVAKDGTIYIADRDLPGVWKWADGKLEVYFRGSKKFRTPLNAVRCLAIDKDGKLLAGDSSTREIYRFDDQGQPQPLTKGNVGIPMALAIAHDGAIIAGDQEIQRIVRVPAPGGEPEILAEITAPRGVTVDGDGAIWVASHGKDAVVKFSPDGKTREVIAAGRPFQFSHHIVVAPDNKTAYVVDGYAKTIWKVEPGAEPKPLFAGEPLKNPVGLAWTDAGLIVVDPHTKTVYRLSFDGKLETLFPAK